MPAAGEPLVAATADGVALALRRHVAAGRRRAVALCTHAMMASGAYLDGRLAPDLARRGVTVYVLDWRGHGASRPPHPRSGSWQFDDYVAADLPAAIRAVCADAGVRPRDLVYVGHSLGGLVGLAAFGVGAAPPPAQLWLVATSVWLPGPAGPRGRRAAMRLARAVARVVGYAPVRALRAGTDDEPRAYVEQLAGWALSGRWTGRGGVDFLARAHALDVPATAVVGAGDRWCTPADARALAPRARLVLVPGDHFGAVRAVAPLVAGAL
ncbi:MAG: alpha/beta fold hydrolase [Deltaproteobacteria bacterium]|nr:MAG: alpha/beta fold hydrolase [Deltaproteobacteria bacterium]